jgi:hypothetical protein
VRAQQDVLPGTHWPLFYHGRLSLSTDPAQGSTTASSGGYWREIWAGAGGSTRHHHFESRTGRVSRWATMVWVDVCCAKGDGASLFQHALKKLCGTRPQISNVCACVRVCTRLAVCARLRKAVCAWYASNLCVCVHASQTVCACVRAFKSCVRVCARLSKKAVCVIPKAVLLPPQARENAMSASLNLTPLGKHGCVCGLRRGTDLRQAELLGTCVCAYVGVCRVGWQWRRLAQKGSTILVYLHHRRTPATSHWRPRYDCW